MSSDFLEVGLHAKAMGRKALEISVRLGEKLPKAELLKFEKE